MDKDQVHRYHFCSRVSCGVEAKEGRSGAAVPDIHVQSFRLLSPLQAAKVPYAVEQVREFEKAFNEAHKNAEAATGDETEECDEDIDEGTEEEEPPAKRARADEGGASAAAEHEEGELGPKGSR